MGTGIQEWKENLWWADNEFRFICGAFELLGRHQVEASSRQIYGARVEIWFGDMYKATSTQAFRCV